VPPYNYELLNFYNKHFKTSERAVPEKRQRSLRETLDQLSKNNDIDFSKHELQNPSTGDDTPLSETE